MLGIDGWMVIPFPIHPFVKIPQPCSLWSNLGVGLSTGFVSLLCLLLLVQPAEAWHCFTLVQVFFQWILWHEKTSPTRIWDITGPKSREKRWAWMQEDFPLSVVMWCTFLWPYCWFTSVWYKNDTSCLPLMFIFLNCLSFQLSGRNSSSPLLKAKTTRTRPSFLCEARGTKIPASLYKDLRQNNSGDCCRSRRGRKQITP